MKILDKQTLFESSDLSCDLARKSVRGALTTIGSQGVLFLLGVTSMTILARLLTPSDYGMVGMAMVVVKFAVMFKDAGLSFATVQKEKITHEQISTLFWLNLLISCALSLVVLVCSPLVALFYGKNELTAITAVLSLSFILSGLTIQHQALQRRHLQFGTLAVIQIVSQLITLTVMIAMALLGWRYWSLVVGTLTSALAGSLLTFFLCPWIPGPMRRGTGVRKMLKFGADLTVANFAFYFSRNGDNLLIGKFLGSESLGLYSRAYALFMMPISQIRGPITRVATPILCSLHGQPLRYCSYFLRMLDVVVSLTLPLSLYCAIEAEFIIKFMLGDSWMEVVPVFRILSIAAMVQAISGLKGTAMATWGLSRDLLKLEIFNAFFTFLSFIVGLQFGIRGVAIGLATWEMLFFFPSLVYCLRKTPVSYVLFLRVLTIPFLLSIVSALIATAVSILCSTSYLIEHLVFLGTFIFFYVSVSAFRKVFRDTVKTMIMSYIQRSESKTH